MEKKDRPKFSFDSDVKTEETIVAICSIFLCAAGAAISAIDGDAQTIWGTIVGCIFDDLGIFIGLTISGVIAIILYRFIRSVVQSPPISLAISCVIVTAIIVWAIKS